MSKKSQLELKEKGLTEADIERVKNYKETFKTHYAEMASLSASQLEYLGYNKEQIKLFAKDSWTEEEMGILSASCTVRLSVENFQYKQSTNRTSALLKSSFTWNGVPVFKLTDILALSWNNYGQKSKAGGVTYRHIYGSQPDYNSGATYIAPQGSGMQSFGGGYYFRVAQQDNYFYAQRGFANFAIEKAGESHLEARTEYGHQRWSASLSFSLSGIDIVFTSGRFTEDYDHFGGDKIEYPSIVP